MRITPIDIQQQQFKTKLVGGYSQEEVDRFLEQVAEEVELLSSENNQLREDLSRAKGVLDELRERESTLKETLITTQRVTDDLKANARREAELLIANAQLRAERLLQEAEEKRLQVMEETSTLRRQQVAFETGLRTTIESHLRLLEVGREILAEHAASAPANPTPPLRGGNPVSVSEPDIIDPRLF